MLDKLDTLYPVRYTALALSVIVAMLSLFTLVGFGIGDGVFVLCAALSALGLRDVLQSASPLRRNYPIVGRLFEALQWLRARGLAGHDTPFSTAQQLAVQGLARVPAGAASTGTALPVRTEGHEWIAHDMRPSSVASHQFRVSVGGPGCTQPCETSVFNISALSFGALSGPAIEALNAGAQLGGFAHGSGEGGLSEHHLRHGGDLVWQIGSGFFGCRDEQGHFDEDLFAVGALNPQVRMIELKLSQGAHPGHGDWLPAAKATAEVASLRGVPALQDSVSPAWLPGADTPAQLLAFVTRLRTLSGGKPVGIKLAVGRPRDWFALAKAMHATGQAPDFIVVDGAEGGTGAGPDALAGRAAMPLAEALNLVHNTLVGLNLRDRIRLGASGRIVSAFDIARTMALGADWCNSARGFMFALGCVQAQRCHNNQCPTGIASHDPLRQQALVVADASRRVALFHENTLKALQTLVQSAGLQHPAEFTPQHLMRRVGAHGSAPLADSLQTLAPGALLNEAVVLPPAFADWSEADAERFGAA